MRNLKNRRWWSAVVPAVALSILLAAVSLGAAPPVAPPPTKQPIAPPATAPGGRTPSVQNTTLPVPRVDGWWLERHNKIILDKTKVDPPSLVFVGDSITQGWEGKGAVSWDKHFAPRKAMNLGFSGDRTQHALWRMTHNELDHMRPKLAVIMIGTNNSNGDDHTAQEIADGIQAVVAMVREKQPQTKILLLAIFPRGESPNPQREKIAKASELASKCADGQMVHYMDIGGKFLNADGTISKEIMPDALHLSEKGYQIWAEAIEDKVKELMGETTPSAAPKPSTP